MGDDGAAGGRVCVCVCVPGLECLLHRVKRGYALSCCVFVIPVAHSLRISARVETCI